MVILIQKGETCNIYYVHNSLPVAHTATIVPSSCSCTVHLTTGNVVWPIKPGIPEGFFKFDTSKNLTSDIKIRNMLIVSFLMVSA